MSKIVLITGATGGIGRATARKLGSQGYALQLHYYKNHDSAVQLAKQLQKEFSIDIQLLQADLSKQDGVNDLMESLAQYPDIIVFNAGIAQYSLFTDVTDDEYERMIYLHLTSSFKITQHVLPSMISKKWGRILFMTSIWGESGASCESLYSMVKGGLISLTKSLAKELAPSHITVNAVSPGAIDTQMMSSFTFEERQQLHEQIPMGRMGAPDEVAHVVQFLLEEESRYMTGQVLRVNGGWYT